MALVLAFGVVLLISVSLSGVAARTVLSTALLFLLAGALIGQGGFGLVEIGAARIRWSPYWPTSRCSPCCSPTGSERACPRCGRGGGCRAGRWGWGCR